MASNPTDCCGIHTTCCGSPLKERLTVTVQSGERQSTEIIAYDAAHASTHVWKGSAEIPFAERTAESRESPVELSIHCELGDWILHIDGGKRKEASFVECDPLLLEFHDVDLEGLGLDNQGKCSIYVTE